MAVCLRAFLICAAATLAAAGSAAAAKPPVAFVQSEAVGTSCAELAEKGVRLPIRNETSTPRKVRVGLVLTRADGQQIRPRAVCGGLRRSPRKLVLRPAGARAITLRAANAEAKGTYTGWVAIFGRKGRVARRDLNIAEPATPGLAITPLVTSISAAIHTGDKGPFWVPVQGANADLPGPVKGADGDQPVPVGALTGPSGPVTVTYDGESQSLAAGVSQIGLNLEGDLSPGTYSGQVDLAPEDAEVGPVAIELKVSRSIGWAIALISIGILVGIALLRGTGRMVPAARLRARVAGLATRYAAAVDELKRGPGAKPWQKFEIDKFESLREGLLNQITDAKKKVAVKIDPKTIESIETAIGGVEQQVDLLKEIPDHAHEVETLLLPPVVELPKPADDPGQSRPKLEIEVAKRLEGKPLKADRLKPTIEAMDNDARLLGELRLLESSLAELWQLRKALDRSDLSELDSHLEDCRRTLWLLSDTRGLEHARDQIQRAWEEFVDLRGRQHPAEGAGRAASPVAGALASWLCCKQTMPPLAAVRLAGAVGAHAVVAPLSAAIAAGEATATAPTAPQPPPPPLKKEDARPAVSKALLMQAFVVLAAAAIALIAGLEFLYIGKTWGTVWDFFAAFFWGIGVQTTVTALATSIDDLSGLRWLRRT